MLLPISKVEFLAILISIGTTITTDESGRQYTLYSFRWIIQSLFALSMAMTGFLMVGFSPVSDYVAKMYGIDALWVQA